MQCNARTVYDILSGSYGISCVTLCDMCCGVQLKLIVSIWVNDIDLLMLKLFVWNFFWVRQRCCPSCVFYSF